MSTNSLLKTNRSFFRATPKDFPNILSKFSMTQGILHTLEGPLSIPLNAQVCLQLPDFQNETFSYLPRQSFTKCF